MANSWLWLLRRLQEHSCDGLCERVQVYKKENKSKKKKCWLQCRRSLYVTSFENCSPLPCYSSPTAFLPFHNWHIRVNDFLKWKIISATNGIPHSPWEVFLIEKTKWKAAITSNYVGCWQTYPWCTWDERFTITALPIHFIQNAPNVQAFSYHKQFIACARCTAVNVFNVPLRFHESTSMFGSPHSVYHCFFMVSQLLFFVTTQCWYDLQ